MLVDETHFTTPHDSSPPKREKRLHTTKGLMQPLHYITKYYSLSKLTLLTL